MTTANDYATIAEEASSVDPLVQHPPAANGHKFPPGDPQFQIVSATVSDPVTGLHAMAVVPLVNELPDYSRVYVSYAGTNPDDRADIIADLQTVVGFEQSAQAQAGQALAYAQKVREDVLKDHPEATFETVGHSLGGYLALYVAGELHWPATAFNGPDPFDAMSPQAKEWLLAQIAAGKNPFTNYVNAWDLIGNFHGNRTGAAVPVASPPGMPAMYYHDMETAFEFDANGAVTGVLPVGKSTFRIAENLISSTPSAGRELAAAAVTGLVTFLQTPGVGTTVGRLGSSAIVLMDTVAATSLASSIFSTSDRLTMIKATNSLLVGRLQSVLDEARREAAAIPFVTESDVDACLITQRLHVDENIDQHAIDTVNRRIDDQLATVERLSSGIMNAVVNATDQDAQWASLYLGR